MCIVQYPPTPHLNPELNGSGFFILFHFVSRVLPKLRSGLPHHILNLEQMFEVFYF